MKHLPLWREGIQDIRNRVGTEVLNQVNGHLYYRVYDQKHKQVRWSNIRISVLDQVGGTHETSKLPNKRTSK